MSALKKPALDESESCTTFSTDYVLKKKKQKEKKKTFGDYGYLYRCILNDTEAKHGAHDVV